MDLPRGAWKVSERLMVRLIHTDFSQVPSVEREIGKSFKRFPWVDEVSTRLKPDENEILFTFSVDRFQLLVTSNGAHHGRFHVLKLKRF